jgi:recombinational DNA repair ATPase RecF
MVHTELTVTGLRRIEHTVLEIPPRVVPGCGDRGSGKTSPLEAMLLLARHRSFRMRDSKCLIWRGQDHLRVIVRRWPFWAIQGLGLQVSRDGASARIPLRGQPRPAGQGR